MFSLSRCVLRWGLIGATGLGVLTLMLGPDRIAAGIDQAGASLRNLTDDFVDDPVALRRQLANLAEKYPSRIAEVRSEIADVDRQLIRLEQEMEVARRVVQMTNTDLSEFRVALESTTDGTVHPMRIGACSFDRPAAQQEMRRIATVRSTYRDRLSSTKVQGEFLETQRGRLLEILNALEDEQTRYQAKLWQLDRQIDAIARNERLIDMTEEQQAILAEYDKFKDVGSLDQLESKLAELRTIQEAQLQSLARRNPNSDYEEAAIDQLRDESLDVMDLELEWVDLPATPGPPNAAPMARR